MTRARAYAATGDWHSANADFQETDKLCADGRAKAGSGYCQQNFKLRQPEGARYMYEGARDAGFRSVGLFNNLATIYMDLGKFDEAEEALKEAMALDPGVQAVHHNYALLCIHRWLLKPGKKSEPHLAAARKHIEKALTLGPESTDLRLHAAEVYALGVYLDPDLLTPTLVHLQKAVALGLPTAKLKNAPFSSLPEDPRLLALLESGPAAVAESKALRLLDPLAK